MCGDSRADGNNIDPTDRYYDYNNTRYYARAHLYYNKFGIYFILHQNAHIEYSPTNYFKGTFYVEVHHYHQARCRTGDGSNMGWTAYSNVGAHSRQNRTWYSSVRSLHKYFLKVFIISPEIGMPVKTFEIRDNM